MINKQEKNSIRWETLNHLVDEWLPKLTPAQGVLLMYYFRHSRVRGGGNLLEKLSVPLSAARPETITIPEFLCKTSAANYTCTLASVTVVFDFLEADSQLPYFLYLALADRN